MLIFGSHSLSMAEAFLAVLSPFLCPSVARQSQVTTAYQRAVSRINLCNFQTNKSQCIALSLFLPWGPVSLLFWMAKLQDAEAWTLKNHLERNYSRESSDLECILHN